MKKETKHKIASISFAVIGVIIILVVGFFVLDKVSEEKNMYELVCKDTNETITTTVGIFNCTYFNTGQWHLDNLVAAI